MSPEGPLVSETTAAAAGGAFAVLASAIPIGDGNRTLEEIVKELLRPMLKQWLDENLPQTVERLVQAEIDRVSRKH